VFQQRCADYCAIRSLSLTKRRTVVSLLFACAVIWIQCLPVCPPRDIGTDVAVAGIIPPGPFTLFVQPPPPTVHRAVRLFTRVAFWGQFKRHQSRLYSRRWRSFVCRWVITWCRQDRRPVRAGPGGQYACRACLSSGGWSTARCCLTSIIYADNGE